MLPMGPTPMRPEPRLALTVLGEVALCALPGGVLIGPGKSLAVVTYLACAPRRVASREHLIDLFWSDLHPDRSRHALRQAIWYLRQFLGAEGLVARGSGIELAATIVLDRDEFLVAIEANDLARAAALYRGDFLTGFAAPGSVAFEHWADIERQRLRSAFLRVAESLANRWLSEGKHREAQQLARRARDLCPGAESNWRLLFETLIQGGDRLALTLEVDRFERELASQGRAPEPATERLMARAQLATPASCSPEQPMGLVAELVGREQEFATIVGGWETGAGLTRQIHVSAPAGLGKTRLLADVAVRLRALGARVVQLRANPGQRDIAYSLAGNLAAALAALPGSAAVSPATAGILVGLEPTLSARFSQAAVNPVGDEAVRVRAAALAELIRAVAEEQRLALLLDDLHWLDLASGRVLASILGDLTAPGSLVVTAGRPSPNLEIIPERAVQLTLAPLTSGQIAALTASLGRLTAEPWSATLPHALAASTGGSPLLVLETLQLAMDRGWLGLEDGTWACPEPEALARALEAGSALRHRLEQLDREGRWLLVLLAVAGTPVSNAHLHAAAGSADGPFRQALATLEERGLATQSAGQWQPAHDEIAAESLASASPESLRAAHLGLGRALVAGEPTDPRQLPRAARHLRAAGAAAELSRLFVRRLHSVRRLGDRRRVGLLAYELLGEGCEPSDVEHLIRGISRWDRLRYSSVRSMALMVGVAILALATTLTLVVLHEPPGDRALLVWLADSAGHSRVVRLPLRTAPWVGGDPLSLARAQRARLPAELLASSTYVPNWNPADSAWAWTADKGDGGITDVFLTTSEGAVRRLTDYPRDDNFEDWSPDGKRLLITTARWSLPELDDYDVAELDQITGSLRRLTFTRDGDYAPRWSPDGRRIAFQRVYKETPKTSHLCFIPPDSVPEPLCVKPTGAGLAGFHDWWGPDSALIQVDSAGAQFLAALEIGTGRWRNLARSIPAQVTFSPDGEWIALSGTTPGDTSSRWLILPRDRPSQARPLMPVEPATQIIKVAWETPAPHEYVERLRLRVPRDTIALGRQHHLTVTALSPTGNAVPLSGGVRWSTKDTTILQVAGYGIVTPRRAGATIIRAELPGWRADSLTVTIVGEPHRTLLEETWDGRWRERWQIAGTPRPEVVTGPGGVRGFWNNGDGSYGSFGYTHQQWDASAGIGVEALVSTPVTGLQFQRLHIQLLGGLSGDWMRRMDTLRGITPTIPATETIGECSFAYPAIEGVDGLDRAAMTSPVTKIAVGPWIRSREWYRVRVQIFPDGTCGMSINGVPAWWSGPRPYAARPLRVVLGYSSKGTRILVGPLEVWRGVKPDVDWSALDTLPERRRELADRPGAGSQ